MGHSPNPICMCIPGRLSPACVKQKPPRGGVVSPPSRRARVRMLPPPWLNESSCWQLDSRWKHGGIGGTGLGAPSLHAPLSGHPWAYHLRINGTQKFIYIKVWTKV